MAPRPHQAMIIVMNLGANKTQVEKLVVFFMNAENHKQFPFQLLHIFDNVSKIPSKKTKNMQQVVVKNYPDFQNIEHGWVRAIKLVIGGYP